MVSLLPAVATVIGLVVLGQVPDVTDLAGIACVIVGVRCTVSQARNRIRTADREGV